MIIHISTWSLWNMGLFRWTEMVYPGRNRRKTTHEALHQQLSVSLFLVCIEVRQKLTSHRYVENGSNVKIALFARVGNSLEVANQKFSKGRSAKLNFKPRSYLSLVSFSCSCKIISFPPIDAELFVSLTQSRHSVEAEEKWILITFHHNLKKKNRKNHVSDFFEFHFSSYGENSSKIDNFEYKNDHTSKIWELIFNLCQRISHLSCIFVQFWRKKMLLKIHRNLNNFEYKSSYISENLEFNFWFDSAVWKIQIGQFPTSHQTILTAH